MAASNLAEIAEHIRSMKFRKKLFGGVDERDVWRQIAELDEDYQNLFKLQNQIYRMQIKKLRAAVKQMNAAQKAKTNPAKPKAQAGTDHSEAPKKT